MIIDANFKGLKQIQNGDYVFEGNLESKETIEIHLDDRFVIKGSIITEKSIIAERDIEAGEGIKAGWGIKAGCGIEAGFRIFAGTSVYRSSKNCIKTISCKRLIKGEIAFGQLIERGE